MQMQMQMHTISHHQFQNEEKTKQNYAKEEEKTINLQVLPHGEGCDGLPEILLAPHRCGGLHKTVTMDVPQRAHHERILMRISFRTKIRLIP